MLRVRSLVVAALVVSAAPLCAEVRVWEGTLDLPTYQEGLPNPNPPYDVFSDGRFNYPYTLRENLTGERRNVSWRAVYLENEYLKCSVLPDIGGHLYTCVDKISGQPMFYANPSIKKARIGYRGAWAAFGIEFNFPVSHNWLSMSPVQYAYAKHDDGSASITVGDVDRVYGMQWNVELVLRPASTVLEEHVTLTNRSDVRHRFYWWNNAGVEVWDDSKVCYPMRFGASHGFTHVETWPVDSTGLDLSVIANQKHGPVSMFVHGSREPFMGVYHPHTSTGVVHYADYGDLPGKKIWSWGVDADGLDWRRALSDNNSAYVEVQAGLMRNQETYAFLQPRQTIRFAEYWMPVRAIGGVARANLAGVVNLSRADGKLIAGLNVNQAVPGAHIRILNGSQAVFEDTADLTPEHTWSHDVASAHANTKYTFELRDAKGKVLLAQTEGVYDWTPESEIHVGPQKNFKAPPADKRSEDDFVQVGKDEELNGALLRAYDTYQQGLERYPESFALSVASGRLAAQLLRYEEAVKRLEPAQARATYDPEIAYYLGVAYDGLGDTRKARTQFETAQRMPEFHAAGCLKLGELLAREGDYNSAAKYFERTLRAAPDDQRAAEQSVAVLKTLGREDDAQRLKTAWLARFPADMFLTGKTNSDPQRVLRIAAQYMRLGLWQQAVAPLSEKYPPVPAEQTEPGAPQPQDDPIVSYYRGYCREKLGESGTADFALASKQSAQFVFPSGAETFAVLKTVLQKNQGDATAHFMLGSLLLNTGRVDDAIAQWKQAEQLNPKIPVLHASLGRTLLTLKHQPKAALDAFRAGVAADPDNVELYYGMNQALSDLKSPASERVAAIEKYPDPAHMPTPLVYTLARTYAEAGEFDKAEALFRDRFFEREEGGTNVRQVWLEVRLARAQAEAAAQHCPAALEIVRGLDKEVPGLAFTKDGLEEFLARPHFKSAVAQVEQRCKAQ